MNKYSLINIQSIADNFAIINIIEGKDLPFQIKRVYTVCCNLDNGNRGYHAHKNLKQVIVCLSGAVKFKLNDGAGWQTIILKANHSSLYINGVVWREFEALENNSIIMVLASEEYSESDYIRNYSEFINYGYK